MNDEEGGGRVVVKRRLRRKETRTGMMKRWEKASIEKKREKRQKK